MKKRRICMMDFRLYEADAFTEYLNEMADQGWFLTKFWAGFLWFDCGEPGMRRYLAVAMPEVSVFDSEDGWESRRFREPYERAGWKFVSSRTIWQIFARDAKTAWSGQGETGEAETAPVEMVGQGVVAQRQDAMAEAPEGVMAGETIEGEIIREEIIEEKLEHLRQSKAFSLSWRRWGATLGWMAYMIWAISQLFRHPGEALASNQTLLLAAVLTGSCLLYPVQMFGAVRWYRRAEQMLRQTGTVPKGNLNQIRRRNMLANSYLAVVILGLFMVVAGEKVSTAVSSVSTWVVLVIVSSLVLHWVREHGTGDRRDKMIGYGVGSFCIGFILIMLVNGAVTAFMPGADRKEAYHRQAEFPVDFSELGFEVDDSWYYTSDRSVIGLHQREAGVRTGAGSQKEYLVLEYYENRIPAVITKTRREYEEAMRRGNVWEVSEEELVRDGEYLVTHCHYQMKKEEQPYLAQEIGAKRDTYLISDRNRFFVIAFEDGTGDTEGRAAVELALERMRK